MYNLPENVKEYLKSKRGTRMETKTTGMNFIEAVQAMKEGLILRRLGCSGFIDKNRTTWTTGQGNGRDLSYDDFESTDWQIVDEDKDWSLKQFLRGCSTDFEYPEDQVQKCYGLILEDISKMDGLSFGDMVVDKRDVNQIIIDRFGLGGQQ